jgi:hypothetical protein
LAAVFAFNGGQVLSGPVLEYVAISDLNEIELQEFANLIQAATAEKPATSR